MDLIEDVNIYEDDYKIDILSQNGGSLSKFKKKYENALSDMRHAIEINRIGC